MKPEVGLSGVAGRLVELSGLSAPAAGAPRAERVLALRARGELVGAARRAQPGVGKVEVERDAGLAHRDDRVSPCLPGHGHEPYRRVTTFAMRPGTTTTRSPAAPPT